MSENIKIENDTASQTENLCHQYRYVCESCGHQTDWFDVPVFVNDETITRDLMKVNPSIGYLTEGKACPMCQKPQSWYTSQSLEMLLYFFPSGMIVCFVLVWLVKSGLALEIERRWFSMMDTNLEPGFVFMFLTVFLIIITIGCLFGLCFELIKKFRQKAQTAKLPRKNKPEVVWKVRDNKD